MTDHDHDLSRILQRLSEMEKRSGSEKVWEYTFRALVPVTIAVVGWVWNQEARVSKLEYFAEHHPPQWLKNDITSIKGSLKDIEHRLRVIENGKKPR